ncbi:DUF2759 family protein [Paenibacillus sp. KN14-4R]|uniref:DUF2759 family protein n=1 Tax=Paenibacillus sp. KN14-4R TaxID=3445773 RepID=UPI003FA155A1
MFLAAEEAVKSTFSYFDPFVLVLTVLIALGFIRLVMEPKKNKFAIGFAFVSLLVFGFMDVIMIKGW